MSRVRNSGVGTTPPRKRKLGGAAVGAPLLRDRAYDALRDAIRAGKYPPGTPMSESVISVELGISRTPVREALRNLVQEGLVQVHRGRGAVIAAPSMDEVLNVLHLRSMLEPELVRLVAETASERTIKIITACVDQMEAAAGTDDRASWMRWDNDLHETLTEFCPNVLLGQLILQLRNRMHLIAVDARTSPVRLQACTAEHRAIVAAIAAGDSAAASAAVEAHLQKLRESLFSRLGYSTTARF